jgi:hypothetical protein
MTSSSRIHPRGEYTRHRRHEEVGRAVISLWDEKVLSTDALWCFAYEDGNRTYLPRPIKIDTVYHKLTTPIWDRKYDIITRTYGFSEDSWEARTTPKAEAFWQFNNAAERPNLGEHQTRSKTMKVLCLYDYPPSPGGLATQGDLLYQGLRETGCGCLRHRCGIKSGEGMVL